MSDTSFSPALQIFPVSSVDKSVKYFKEMEKDILKLVQNQSSYTISLFKRGYNIENSIPVISIVCPEIIDITNINNPEGILIEHNIGKPWS